MKNKNFIELPKKAVSVMINDSYSLITYYENSKDEYNDRNIKEVKVPSWLAELITKEVKTASEEAVDDFKQSVLRMFE
jgi:hypothetical protein